MNITIKNVNILTGNLISGYSMVACNLTDNDSIAIVFFEIIFPAGKY